MSLSLSYLLPFIVSLAFLPKIKLINTKVSTYQPINSITLILAILALFYSADILLAKHFFTDYLAGLYSAASLYGKVIIFVSISIAMVLLPKSIEAKNTKKDSISLLAKSLFLVISIGIPLIAVYYLFPKQLISLTLGTEYLPVAGLIAPYALGAIAISIVYVLVFYIISLRKERRLWIPLLFICLIEPIIILLYHTSLVYTIVALITPSMIAVVFLSIYITQLRKTSEVI